MLRSIVAKSQAKGNCHHNSWSAPCHRVVEPCQLLIVEDLDHKDVEMDALDQLPGEGAEEEVVEQDSDGGADSVVTWDEGAIHSHQEESLGEAQGYCQLSVDVMQLLRLQSVKLV